MNPQFVLTLTDGKVQINGNVAANEAGTLLLLRMMEVVRTNLMQIPKQEGPGILVAQQHIPSLNGGK